MAIGDKDPGPASRSEVSKTDKRKQSLYFPESMLQEIKEEAARLDRSLSWVVQRAWKRPANDSCNSKSRSGAG